MLHLIPSVKRLEIKDGFLEKSGICYRDVQCDERVRVALNKLPYDASGAFYAVQTLHQIFTHNQIPCLYIQDKPDFPYHGFYHDVTRRKIPTVKAINKKIVSGTTIFKTASGRLIFNLEQ